MPIRVESNSEYKIPIQHKNEAGKWETTDHLVFDTSDTGLTSRLFQMYDTIEQLTAKAEADARAIDERPDKPMRTLDGGEDGERVLITQNQYDGAQLIDKFYKDARAALDIFLGEGACQKIFKDKNYTEMFNDLLTQLKPEFDKMGLDAQKLRKSAAAKHKPNRAERRTLK